MSGLSPEVGGPSPIKITESPFRRYTLSSADKTETFDGKTGVFRPSIKYFFLEKKPSPGL